MIAVYAGQGSSHSWMWMAELLESSRAYGVRFLEANELQALSAADWSALLISGGDGFEIASAIGPRGFRRIADFVRDGGTYVGVCAGAYLALRSSVDPFRDFTLSSTKIRNIRPRAEMDSCLDPRDAVDYGTCSIYHPFRGETSVGDGDATVLAPVYGGPIFREPSEDKVKMRFQGLGPGVRLNDERARVEEMVIGTPAVVESSFGHGRALLSSPHLEHPDYPEANAAFIRLVGLERGPRARRWHPDGRRPNVSVRRALADLKVAIMGLEGSSFIVGRKVWDGGRMLEFVSTMTDWGPSLDGEAADRVCSELAGVRNSLVEMSRGGDRLPDDVPHGLVEAARMCANEHFSSLKG